MFHFKAFKKWRNSVYVLTILIKIFPFLKNNCLKMICFTVTDVIHDLHSKFFKVANVYATTWKYEPENISVWLQHNLYLGYSILLVSYFAILYTIFRELCTFGIISKNKIMFFEEFYTSYGMIWSLSLLLCLNIILCGTDCDYFM